MDIGIGLPNAVRGMDKNGIADAQQVVQSTATDADTLKGYLSAFEQADADEVICFPASSDPAQVELLAEAAGL